MRRPTRLLQLVVAAALVAGPAFGQDASTLKEAKLESDAGARLFKEKVFEVAIRHYQRAYEIAHQPADLQRVAESQREMGELGRAYETYAKLLSTHATQLGPKAAAITSTLADLEQKTGLLTVRCSVIGATVKLEERVVGVTPLAAPVRLSTGGHHVSVSKEGFEPFLAEVGVDPAHPVTVEATIAPRVITGHLSVREMHGATAKVVIDGQTVGALPWEGDVSAGTHQVSLQSTAVSADAQTVVVQHGAKAQTVFTGTMLVGHVHIDAKPPAAKIAIDGKEMATGLLEADIPVGTHTIKVSLDGFRPATQSIVVQAGATGSQAFTLEPGELSPEAEAARKKAEDAEALRGLYGQITGFGGFGNHAQNVSCAGLMGDPQCSDGFPLAGGVSLRGGYSLGMVSFELVGMFLADGHTDTISYPGPSSTAIQPPPTSASGVSHDESYNYSSLGGMIAVGPRFATPGRNFRVTVGAAGGVAIRSFQFARQLSSGLAESPTQSFEATNVSPGITCDLGFIMGSTPGASFLLGAMLWADFPKTLSTKPVTTVGTAQGSSFAIDVPGYTVEHGTQLYIGPYLGIRFGH